MTRSAKERRDAAIIDLIDILLYTHNIILIPEYAGTGTGNVARYRYCVHVQTPRNLLDITTTLGYALNYRVTFRNNNPTSFITTDKPSEIIDNMRLTFPLLANKGVSYNVMGHSIKSNTYTLSIDNHQDIQLGVKQSLAADGVLTITMGVKFILPGATAPLSDEKLERLKSFIQRNEGSGVLSDVCDSDRIEMHFT